MPPPVLASGPQTPELWSYFDLPQTDLRSRELSGICWDSRAGFFWVVPDEGASIHSLIPDRDLKTWKFGETVQLEFTEPVDLEGIVVHKDGFFLCSEIGAKIFDVDRNGKKRREITLPPRFATARKNKSLESIAMSPSGKYLFTATEIALPEDGDRATIEQGTRCRVARVELASGAVSEALYETDVATANGADVGISELLACDDDRLWVLERSWQRGYGNRIRIYETQFSDTAKKKLVIDVGTLQAQCPLAKQPQPNPLLDNYEGMALGPKVKDRQSLVLISDDNGHDEQVARILVLLC